MNYTNQNKVEQQIPSIVIFNWNKKNNNKSMSVYKIKCTKYKPYIYLINENLFNKFCFNIFSTIPIYFLLVFADLKFRNFDIDDKS